MIIDTHVHFGSIMNFDMPAKMLLTSLKEYNIHAAIVSNILSSECDENQIELPSKFQTPQNVSIKETIQLAKENKGKLYAALWCKPRLESPNDELENLIKNNLDIIKALKFHPYHSATPFDSPKIQDYFYLAQKYNLTVITHTGNGDCDNCNLVFKMAKKYPSIKFVMAHLGLGTDNQEAIDLCAKQENLYADTAWVSIQSAVDFVKRASSKKLFFGSDNPIDGINTYKENRYGQRSLYQDYFYKLADYISIEDYENIMWRNASETYNIK